ncbi:MAG: carbon-nitrogen hydrolase family protein [Acidobacteria bacterium]|nr:carbon-nitrogen hydrolase family protein [Acidobacteriota bacterium]
MSWAIAAAQSASVPGDLAANVANHLRFVAGAATAGVQLLVFPELSLTGYELDLAASCAIHPDDERLAPLRAAAERRMMIIVAGSPIFQHGLHIGSLAFLPDGAVSVYTKQHVHASELQVFAPGAGGEDLMGGEPAQRVARAICFDATRASHAAAAAARGASVYAASVMIDRAGYARKTALLAGYARMHRMTVLMANYSGVSGGEVSAGGSAIWNALGEVLAEAPPEGEALLIARTGHSELVRL